MRQTTVIALFLLLFFFLHHVWTQLHPNSFVLLSLCLMWLLHSRHLALNTEIQHVAEKEPLWRWTLALWFSPLSVPLRSNPSVWLHSANLEPPPPSPPLSGLLDNISHLSVWPLVTTVMSAVSQQLGWYDTGLTLSDPLRCHAVDWRRTWRRTSGGSCYELQNGAYAQRCCTSCHSRKTCGHFRRCFCFFSQISTPSFAMGTIVNQLMAGWKM